MTFILPSRELKKWSQSNSSDIFGTLQRTRNMDFDQESYAKLAKRARSIYDFSGIDRRLLWIKYFQATDKYWLMNLYDPAIYSVDGTTLAVTDESATSNVPSTDTTGGRNDSVEWQGYLYATSVTKIRRYNGSGWSLPITNSAVADVTISGAGFLAVHEQKNALAVTQGNTVKLFDTSHDLLQTLTVPAEFQATSLDYANGFIVLGTRNINNGEAKVFLWSGNNATYDSGHGVGAPRVESVRKYGNTFIALNSYGKLLRFNGGGFDTIGAFPIYYREVDWSYDGASYLGRVINRGMVVDGDLIYINLSPRIVLPSTDTTNHVFENWFEGGVWCYDPKVGLYHRYCHTSSLRVSNAIATSSVDTTNDIITVSSGAPVSGTPVIYDSSNGTAILGLVNRTKYYVIYITTTTIKLATTRQNALDGVAIDLTGTGNSSQLLIYVPNRDFGGSTLGGNGLLVDAGSAITLVSNREGLYRTNGSQVIFGTRIGKTSIGGAYGLAIGTFGQENRGYLITPKLQSQALTEMWQNVSIKFRGVDMAEDKILVKYRNIERTDTLTGIDLALTQTATWVNTSMFTTTATTFSSAKKGDEISFHSGSGSGYIAHIFSISESGGTYTVTLDEVIQNVTAGDTVGFVVENWNKIGTITTDDVDYFTNDNGDRYASDSGLKTFTIGKQSRWIELKIELRGEDVKIEEIMVNGKSFKQFIN